MQKKMLTREEIVEIVQYCKENLSKPKYYPNLTFYYIEYQ